MTQQNSNSRSFLLDCILSAVLEVRQKHRNLVLLLKHTEMLSALTTIKQQLLHKLVVSVIENLYLPRSTQVNPIILVYTSRCDEKIYIRFVASKHQNPDRIRLSDSTYYSSTKKLELTQVLITIQEPVIGNQILSLQEF